MEFPRWMYRKDLPKGKIFKDEKQLEAAGDGWVNSPAQLQRKAEAWPASKVENASA